MTKIIFNNKPNERISVRYKQANGRTSYVDAWISRSSAIVGVVFFKNNVLVTRRSVNMYTEPGKLCLPCGYLDWNENGYAGMVREVYEETSLFLPDYDDKLLFNNNKQPFFVETDPQNDKNQNVSLMYISYFDIDTLPDMSDYSNYEVDEIFWLSMKDFYDGKLSNNDWGFNHPDVIKNALNYFNYNYK